MDALLNTRANKRFGSPPGWLVLFELVPFFRFVLGGSHKENPNFLAIWTGEQILWQPALPGVLARKEFHSFFPGKDVRDQLLELGEVPLFGLALTSQAQNWVSSGSASRLKPVLQTFVWFLNGLFHLLKTIFIFPVGLKVGIYHSWTIHFCLMFPGGEKKANGGSSSTRRPFPFAFFWRGFPSNQNGAC